MSHNTETTTPNITAKKSGRFDYMGFAWHTILIDGQPIIEHGVKLQFHAFDCEHAIAMFNQLQQIRQRIAAAK